MDLEGIGRAVNSNQQKGANPFIFTRMGQELTKPHPKKKKAKNEEDSEEKDVKEKKPTNRAEGMDMSPQGDPERFSVKEVIDELSPYAKALAKSAAKGAAKAALRGGGAAATITADMVKKGAKKAKQKRDDRKSSASSQDNLPELGDFTAQPLQTDDFGTSNPFDDFSAPATPAAKPGRWGLGRAKPTRGNELDELNPPPAQRNWSGGWDPGIEDFPEGSPERAQRVQLREDASKTFF